MQRQQLTKNTPLQLTTWIITSVKTSLSHHLQSLFFTNDSWPSTLSYTLLTDNPPYNNQMKQTKIKTEGAKFQLTTANIHNISNKKTKLSHRVTRLNFRVFSQNLFVTVTHSLTPDMSCLSDGLLGFLEAWVSKLLQYVNTALIRLLSALSRVRHRYRRMLEKATRLRRWRSVTVDTKQA